MKKVVIFDMDGVMIDSEPLWDKTETILLSRRGIDYNPSYRDKIIGLNQNDSGKLLKETFKLEETVKELLDERISILLQLYERELKPMQGLLPLLNVLEESGFLLAVASSSPYRVIRFVLDKLALSNFFRVVISGDFVELGKPKPDIYLLAAKELGVNPAECIVIEDSINGLKSAKAAGMLCIAVPDKRLNQKEFGVADLVFEKLEEINLTEVESLIQQRA